MVTAAPGQGLLVLCAACLLIGSSCFAAGTLSGPTSGAATADFIAESLLRTIVQQIAGGRIISPPDDNAMQTWQRVLQRDIATQRSPEVLKALEDFDTFARTRAADEKAAGRPLVAAELTVFADQASRMIGRVPPVEASVTGSAAPDAGNVTKSDPSVGANTAPEAVTDGTTAPAQSAAHGASPAADAARDASPEPRAAAVGAALLSASPGTVSAAAGVTHAEVAPEAASGTAPPGPAANRVASVTEAVIHIVSETQPVGTAPDAGDTTGDDGRLSRAGGSAGLGRDAAGTAQPAAADTAAADAVHAQPGGPTAAAHGDVPFDRLAGQLPPQAFGPAVPPLAEVGTTTAAPPGPAAAHDPAGADVAAAPQSAPPAPAMAEFYAVRGDAMLAHKDISAARKFYEFAANAGSARAAVALAKTYDPAFAGQLGEVGLRPDAELAAAWYRKAEQLGGRSAQLSQSGDTGK